MIDVKHLKASDQLALAALLRLAVRLDGEFSQAEQEALEDVAIDVGERSFWNLMDEAGRNLPDEESIRTAALAVTDPEARAAIYECVLHVARSDAIQTREMGLLEWLQKNWSLDREGNPIG